MKKLLILGCALLTFSCTTEKEELVLSNDTEVFSKHDVSLPMTESMTEASDIIIDNVVDNTVSAKILCINITRNHGAVAAQACVLASDGQIYAVHYNSSVWTGNGVMYDHTVVTQNSGCGC